jgi:hypothetical protein
MDNEPKRDQSDNIPVRQTAGVGPFSRPSLPPEPSADELPAPVVTQSQFGSPKKKSGSKWIVALLVVLVLAALGGVAYWQYTDANSTRSQLSSVENELSLAKAQINKLSTAAADDKNAKNGSTTGIASLTVQQRQELEASSYACVLADFGCEKVTATVKKSLEVNDGKPGFAIVEIKNIRPDINVATNVYLKSIDNFAWVVVYEGKVKPPADIVNKFAIPAEYAQ